MAGSFNHVVDADGNYIGVDLLENMGDMHEAVEQMAFVLLMMRRASPSFFEHANESYYKCCRGEEPWPDWFKNRE